MARKKQTKRAQPANKLAVKNTAEALPAFVTDPHKAPAASVVKESAWPESLSEWIIFCFKRWWALCVLIGTTVLSNVVTQIQGNPSQLWSFVQQHLLFTTIVILVTTIAPFIALREKREDEQKSTHRAETSRQSQGKVFSVEHIAKQLRHVSTTIVIPTILPVITTTLFLTLLLLVLFRPVWCPGFICPPIQTHVATHAGGQSDQNLDAYFLIQQSTSFELPGALQQYTLQNLPRNIAAVRSDSVQSSAYRLVIGVQNLHQTGYEIYIDTVALIVRAVPPLANPLNVWSTSSLAYTTAPYSVTYAGEPTGSVLDATYEPVPSLTGVHQRLQPSETDDIDLQINPTSRLQADLQFQVRITYRMANESQEHTILLPNLFEVVFSNVSNWHLYHF